MTVLTPAAAMALALQCVPPSVAPVMVAIAEHESGLNPVAIHRNANGTVDIGLAQVSSSNFAWLGLTLQAALDPCRNLAAGARVLLAKYNGNPPDSLKATYTSGIMANLAHGQVAAVPSTPLALPRSNPFSKPARTGRDLVFATPITGLDKQ
jgi:soluble lytic murein transglycosylase-like protein